jgi:hypothetical protein
MLERIRLWILDLPDAVLGAWLLFIAFLLGTIFGALLHNF